MKRFFKLAIAVSFFTSSVFCTLSAEGMPVEKVISSITENKITSGDFLQEKTSAKMKRPLKSNGKFVFSKDVIIWQTLKPFPSTMAVTNDSLIQIGADGKKSVIDGTSNETFKSVAATLSSIFSGTKNDIEKYFTIKKFDSNENSWNIVLTPKDSTIGSALKEISLSGSIKASKASLNNMLILQNESDLTKYTLSNQSYRQEFSADEKALFQK